MTDDGPEDAGTITRLNAERASFRAWSVLRPGKWSAGHGRHGNVLAPSQPSTWYLVIECTFHDAPSRLIANGHFFTLGPPVPKMHLVTEWSDLGPPLTTPYIVVRSSDVCPTQWHVPLPPQLSQPYNSACLWCARDGPLTYIAGCGHGFHVACVAQHTGQGLHGTACPECGFGIEDVIASSRTDGGHRPAAV
jgi:hypothetical protein